MTDLAPLFIFVTGMIVGIVTFVFGFWFYKDNIK